MEPGRGEYRAKKDDRRRMSASNRASMQACGREVRVVRVVVVHGVGALEDAVPSAQQQPGEGLPRDEVTRSNVLTVRSYVRRPSIPLQGLKVLWTSMRLNTATHRAINVSNGSSILSGKSREYFL